MATSRRKFIVNGLGYVSLGLTMPAFLKAAVADETMMMSGAGALGTGALPPIPKGKILVVIEMSGGNDGLNTVIPHADPAYAKLRPNIGLPSAEVVKISDKLGLHPRMTAMGKMFEKGEVAVVVGAGYPNPNRSHFESMDIWQSGDPSRTKMERSGWMARYFDSDGHFKGNPLSGVVLGSSMPLALTSHDSPVSVIGNGTDFGNSVAMLRSPAQPGMAGAPMGGTVARSNADFIRNVGNDIYTSSQDIKKAMTHYDDKAALAAAYPANNGLAQSLQTVAKLITGGLGTRIYYLSTGGFDTHANQPPQHAGILGGMSEAIAAFRRDLAFAGRDQDVMLMTFSEFGRRCQENGSAGTDHGAASSMFIVGGATRGGIYGEQPSLTDLDDGDLRFNTDFRRVYATVLDKWLAAPSTPVLGGQFEPLKFL